jgi:phosphohistidine phosphatase
MKNLFLLRHAHSENSILNDFDRPISEEGIDKCKLVGRILSAYQIDKIYSSDALRTKETVEEILPFLQQKPHIEYIHNLYNCSSEKLEFFLEGSEQENILLVNHNPAISQLGISLAKDSIHSSFYHEMINGFSPASLALFQSKKLISFWR